MAHAAHDALTRARCVVLLGADCPAVDAEYLNSALLLLTQGESIVVGPAEDGGYVLLGLRDVPPEIFSGVSWGSAQVMEQTRDRLRRAGRHWRELPTSWDVDRPEDLHRLKDLLPGW